jgi:hypothetical protein
MGCSKFFDRADSDFAEMQPFEWHMRLLNHIIPVG